MIIANKDLFVSPCACSPSLPPAPPITRLSLPLHVVLLLQYSKGLRLAKDLGMSEKLLWSLKVEGLAEGHDWKELEKLSKEKKVTVTVVAAATQLQQCTATRNCNKIQQHTTATMYCNTQLQQDTATHNCNNVLQHTAATRYSHTQLQQYISNILQHTTATTYCNVLQHTSATSAADAAVVWCQEV